MNLMVFGLYVFFVLVFVFFEVLSFMKIFFLFFLEVIKMVICGCFGFVLGSDWVVEGVIVYLIGFNMGIVVKIFCLVFVGRNIFVIVM